MSGGWQNSRLQYLTKENEIALCAMKSDPSFSNKITIHLDGFPPQRFHPNVAKIYPRRRFIPPTPVDFIKKHAFFGETPDMSTIGQFEQTPPKCSGRPSFYHQRTIFRGSAPKRGSAYKVSIKIKRGYRWYPLLILAPTVGLEPTPPWLTVRCSNRLS